MNTISEEEFLHWASTNHLGLDPKYPRSAVLTYSHDSDSRFWEVPPEPQRRPHFLASLLDLMGDWRTCYVWKHLGSWPDPNQVRPDAINDAVERVILKGISLPPNAETVLQFARDERESLVALLFSTTVFGFCIGDDLYIVPDHARQILKTDHHGVVHVDFANPVDAQPWVSKMSQEGFHLPDEPPDPTFKLPRWMRRRSR